MKFDELSARTAQYVPIEEHQEVLLELQWCVCCVCVRMCACCVCVCVCACSTVILFVIIITSLVEELAEKNERKARSQEAQMRISMKDKKSLVTKLTGWKLNNNILKSSDPEILIMASGGNMYNVMYIIIQFCI